MGVFKYTPSHCQITSTYKGWFLTGWCSIELYITGKRWAKFHLCAFSESCCSLTLISPFETIWSDLRLWLRMPWRFNMQEINNILAITLQLIKTRYFLYDIIFWLTTCVLPSMCIGITYQIYMSSYWQMLQNAKCGNVIPCTDFISKNNLYTWSKFVWSHCANQSYFSFDW